MRSVRFYLLVLLLLLAGWAGANVVKDAHVEAELVSEQDALIPGQATWVALRTKIEPHWHTYWVNPGESGLPVSLTWKLPPGFVAGPLQYPLPQKLDVAGIMAYVFEGDVLLPVQLQVPADLKPGTKVKLQASAEWLACAQVCVPGSADLELELPVAESSASTKWINAFQAARQALPQSQPPPQAAASWSGPTMLLTFALPAPPDKVFFAPLKSDIIKDAAEQPLKKGANLYTLTLTPAEGKKPEKLEGVLVVESGGGKTGYTLDLPLVAAAAPPVSPVTLLPTLLGAFVGGLILNLMPCVFPVLSLKVMGVVEQSGEDHSKPWMHGLVFTGGVLICFWLLVGALLGFRHSGQSLGWGFQLQSPIFVAGMACLFFLIGLNLLGVFEVGEDLTRLGDLAQGKTGYAGSFWSGALATIVATPCSAPFMGSAVGIALGQSDLYAFLIFTCLGLGMAFPYLLLVSVPGLLRFVPRPGAWMVTFKQAMAFPMMATVAWLTWVLAEHGADYVLVLMLSLVGLGLAGWILGRWGFDMDARTAQVSRVSSGVLGAFVLVLCVLSLNSLATAPVLWQPYSQEKLEAARAEGRPVFVDFTAAWCLSCQANEKLVLSRDDVKKAFADANVLLLKADWTKKDDAITKALAAFQRSSVPLYVLYPKQGEPEVLPEVITPGIVMDALKKV